MNKLYAYYDFLDVNRTVSYLSYLLEETVAEFDVSYLVWAGHLISYRDNFTTLQEVKVKDNKIVSFGDYHYSKTTSIFPNVKYAIPDDSKKGTQSAYLIKDTQGKTYTAIDIGGQVIRPYLELRLQENILFSVQDLMTIANTANETDNKKSVPKPTPPEKIPFQLFNEQTNKHEEFYIINSHQQDVPNNTYDEELNSNRNIPRETSLTVTGILLERLLNKDNAYKNTNLSQSRIIDDILDQYSNVRSLGKRNLDQILAESNTLLKNIKSMINQKDK